MADAALAIKPGDVDLVEVGELGFVGKDVGSGSVPFINMNDNLVAGKMYVIRSNK